MQETESEAPTWDVLADLIEAGDAAAVEAFLEGLEGSERGLVVSRLSTEEREQLFVLLDPDDAAVLLGQLPEVQAVEMIEGLPAAEAARILEELPSDEQADVIGELEHPEAEAILSEMEPEEAHEVRTLAAYEDDEAGGLMITEVVRATEQTTVAELVEELQEHADRYTRRDLQYAFVTDERGRLVGALLLHQLLLVPKRRRLAEAMGERPVSVGHRDKMDVLADFFEDYPETYRVPVVDEDGVLLGVLRRSAVEEAVAERSEETYRAAQGIIGGEELRTMPLLLRSRRRLGWLSINILLNMLAASVIAMNQETIQAVVALAVFLPIISDMSGCSGNQAVAVSIRELAEGLVRPSELMRVLFKELSVGVINGTVLGILIGLGAWLYIGNAWLGLVVGAALAVNTLVAVAIGGSVPLVLKRLGSDPALASGPILTTITDMCGFLLALTLAAALLPRLV